MTLVQKTINDHEYYTDGNVYYTFYRVEAATDTLWSFACRALGITSTTGFTSQETRDITDLAGIGPIRPTRFLLLKNGSAVPLTYRANGSPALVPDDIILRLAVSPVAPGVPKSVRPPDAARSSAERLQEIDDLRNRKLLTETEYQDKRTKLIAEL